jgi:hypothetical protein
MGGLICGLFVCTNYPHVIGSSAALFLIAT